MANGHGGARPGAGRKAKAEKYAAQIAAAEDQIADRLPRLIGNLLKLADGGFEVVENHYAPAGTVTVGSGEYLTLVYPDKLADELVLIKRVKSRAAPDRAANIDLINRILGKPTTQVEVSGEDGGPLFKVYVNIDPDQV